jgi:hypothetical protein
MKNETVNSSAEKNNWKAICNTIFPFDERRRMRKGRKLIDGNFFSFFSCAISVVKGVKLVT